MNNFCGCKDCKKMKRKGFILGSRYMEFWLNGENSGGVEHYRGSVSAYVPYFRYLRGKRSARRQKNENIHNLVE
jgi:hypothetical protein